LQLSYTGIAQKMEQRIIQLLARKLSGEATPEELNELDQLLTRAPEGIYYAELITQLWDEEKIPGVTRTITDTDISYLRHLARHRPQFRQPAVPDEVPPAYDLSPFPARRRRIPQMVWLIFFAVLTAGMLTAIAPSAGWHPCMAQCRQPHPL
jgi:ferric-dicitrate binding protein FerR (iron transport regulator)